MADRIPFDVAIPERFDWAGGHPPWRIRDALRKLQDLYGGTAEGTLGWRAYDAYGFARARHDPTWPNRLVGGDVGIAFLVGVTLSPAEVDGLLAERVRAQAAEALAGIPTDWALSDAIGADQWERLERLYLAMDVPGLDVRKLTRVACVKRPRLCPAIDTPGAERRARKPGALARAAMSATREVRDVLLHNRLAVHEIAARMNAWLPEVIAPDQRLRLTPARVLSELLWFDLGGFRRFEGWRERGGEVVLEGAGERRRGRRRQARR